MGTQYNNFFSVNLKFLFQINTQDTISKLLELKPFLFLFRFIIYFFKVPKNIFQWIN